MHSITRQRLNEFIATHPEAKSALTHWYKQMKAAQFRSFATLREVFPSADQVGRLTVFNVGGNNIRLIAAVHYNRGKVYIRGILTRAEYDKDNLEGVSSPC